LLTGENFASGAADATGPDSHPLAPVNIVMKRKNLTVLMGYSFQPVDITAFA
jgi:hypothetical protein